MLGAHLPVSPGQDVAPHQRQLVCGDQAIAEVLDRPGLSLAVYGAVQYPLARKEPERAQRGRRPLVILQVLGVLGNGLQCEGHRGVIMEEHPVPGLVVVLDDGRVRPLQPATHSAWKTARCHVIASAVAAVEVADGVPGEVLVEGHRVLLSSWAPLALGHGEHELEEPGILAESLGHAFSGREVLANGAVGLVLPVAPITLDSGIAFPWRFASVGEVPGAVGWGFTPGHTPCLGTSGDLLLLRLGQSAVVLVEVQGGRLVQSLERYLEHLSGHVLQAQLFRVMIVP